MAKRQSVERAQQQLRWKRGELIGTGAFGRVFKALNEDTGALLAVKELTRIQPSSDANMNTHTNAAAARSGERERAEKARLELANEILRQPTHVAELLERSDAVQKTRALAQEHVRAAAEAIEQATAQLFPHPMQIPIQLTH